MSRTNQNTLKPSATLTTSLSTTDITYSKTNPMNQCGDPHLRNREEFGVLGNTGKIGKDTFVGCQVI